MAEFFNALPERIESERVNEFGERFLRGPHDREGGDEVGAVGGAGSEHPEREHDLAGLEIKLSGGRGDGFLDGVLRPVRFLEVVSECVEDVRVVGVFGNFGAGFGIDGVVPGDDGPKNGVDAVEGFDPRLGKQQSLVGKVVSEEAGASGCDEIDVGQVLEVFLVHPDALIHVEAGVGPVDVREVEGFDQLGAG